MKKLCSSLCLVLALVVLLPQAVHAKRRSSAAPKPNPSAAAPTASPTPAPSTITGVSATSISISSPAGAKTYKTTQYTQVRYKGMPVKITDLKEGMVVVVTATSDQTAANVISANDPAK